MQTEKKKKKKKMVSFITLPFHIFERAYPSSFTDNATFHIFEHPDCLSVP